MRPTDSRAVQLPFLIVHGAVIGVVALVALTLVLAFVGRWALRRSYRRRARRELARLKSQTAPRYPSAHAVLRGRIRAGTLTTVRGAGMTTHARTGAPWLEHFDGPIALAGEVCVVHGTRFSTKWWHAFWPRTERSVTDGDEVIIDGELTRADDGTWELRSIGRMWEPAPVVEARAIAALAKPGAVGLLAAAMIVGAFGVASFGILHHIGTKALDRAWHNFDELRLEDYALAAAMPGTRDDALEQLDRKLGMWPQTDAILGLRGAALVLAGECPAMVDLKAFRFDEAVAEAERCGSRHDKLWTYLFAGRFEDAARQTAPGGDVQPALTIEIALGRWEEAARRLEVAADAAHEPEAAHDRCLVALFRTFAGEAAAFDRLATLHLDATCQVLRALLSNATKN